MSDTVITPIPHRTFGRSGLEVPSLANMPDRWRPGVCTAIFATRTEAQLRDNLGAIG